MSKIKSALGVTAFGFNMTRDLAEVDYPEPEVVECEKPFDPSMEKSLFAQIYSVNPVTGLPQGDLAVFMSENTSPEVKRFIEMNLHQPYNVDGDTSGRQGLTDDDVVAYMREMGESTHDYAKRMLDEVLKAKPQDSSGESEV